MKKWQLHEAKNKLSDLIEVAMKGKPQCITKRGEDAVIVMSVEAYLKLQDQNLNFNDFLLSVPKIETLEVERAKGKARGEEI